MANYKAVSTGVWNALARWQDDSTGSYLASTVLPSVNDVVYANGFTVTLDIDIAVSELRTTTGVSVVAGGGFTYGAGCNTVIGNVIAGTTTCLTHALTTTKTLIGNSTGGTGIAVSGTRLTSSGTLIFVGNMTGGSGSLADGIRNDGGTVFATGNATGGTASTAPGARNVGSGVFTIVGTATGGVTSGNLGATNSASGTMTVDTAIASSAAAGVEGVSSSGVTVVKTAQFSQQGVVPISGFVFFDSTVPNSITVRRNNNTDLTLVDASTGFPANGDVRNGVSYASGSQVGTLIVPPASAVAVGVPVDNTNGTAMIDINQMGALITSFKIS